MYKIIPVAFLLFGFLSISNPSWADSISVNKEDTIRSVLVAHMNKRVTVQTISGKELTGTVKTVNEKVVHLSELSGKEYFDAVVKIKKIEAVIVRTKQ